MSLSGELNGLSNADKQVLDKILKKKTKTSEIVTADISKKVSYEVNRLRRTIALIVARDGTIVHLVVGTKQRVYLPDLGRFRLGESRLRRLRLIVFMPESVTDEVFVYPELDSKKKISAPKIPADILTDLEKLRFDMVCVVSVLEKGDPGAFSVAYIDVPDYPNLSKSSVVNYIYQPSFLSSEIDFNEFISDLEKRFNLRDQKQSKKITKDLAILVGVYTTEDSEPEYSMNELKELCRSAGVHIGEIVVQKRSRIDPKTVLGKGKIEELVLLALDLGAEILIFDRELSPSQLRAISKITELKIIDRSMLILDIFSQRAKSMEGKLQVELAQLKYSLPRLTEKDSGLSRLSGGIGGRGPGETKLEISRRRVRDRITFLEGKINTISKQRLLRRDRRKVRGVPVIAIIGYTNAGKSTLLNTITKGNVLSEDKLFATLDPSSRRMRFPNEKEVLFVDTVGFIRNLPEELIGAFRATLEEVGDADILLHVVDSSYKDIKRHINVVEETLEFLGFAEKQRILVLNKIDLLSTIEKGTLLNSYDCITVSAINREGITELLSRVISSLNNSFSGKDPGGFLDYDSGVLDL